MKQGNTLPTIIVSLLAVGLILYFAFYLWESITDSVTTAIAYEQTISESVETKGVFIREEELLPSTNVQTGLLDILRSEGEQVGVGQEVGRIYRDASVMEMQTKVEILSSEAKNLEFALVEERDLITVTRMDEEIVDAIASLRGAVSVGNLNKLEDQIAQVKGNILRRDYIFGSTQVVKDIEDRYGQVVFEMSNASQMNAGNVNTTYAPVSGAYSILVDGFEYLNKQQAMNMTLSDLNLILNNGFQGATYGMGKIVTGDTWYFVVSIPSIWAEDLVVNRGVTVRFSGDFSQDVTMKVEKISPVEQGQQVIVLSSNRYLEQTTLLRVQSVELVYASHTGLRVPKEALRMESYKDNTTGETVEVYGVYAMSAGYAEFKPVNIVAESKDFYLVEAAREGASALRQGNEIVVHAIGLYNGKLLEY